MLVSIITPCFNEKSHIREFVSQVFSQDRTGLDCEFIIVDGKSNDGTSVMFDELLETHPEIVVLENADRIVPTGLNNAIMIAKGEYVRRMDVHTIYAKNYVRKCIEVLADSGANCVGGPWQVKSPGGKNDAISAVFSSKIGTGGAARSSVYQTPPINVVTGT